MWLEIFLLLLAVVFCVVFFKVMKSFVKLAINSIVGLFMLLLASFVGIYVPINILTLLIVAFGGVPAAILLIVLKLLGLIG
ncbi:MAG: pro-sigmaK processing inhibitor BofA family protein [Candidatus Bilamarchaeaceae archaeon]